MDRARDRITNGSKPQARTAVPEKNDLLAVELQDLLSGRQGVLAFLDNCGVILSLDTIEDVQQLTQRLVPEKPHSEHSLANEGAHIQVAKNLFFRLHPGSQFSDDEIMENVTKWAFLVLPPADVPNTNGDDVSELSLVETEARDSFLEKVEDAKKRRQNQGQQHQQERLEVVEQTRTGQNVEGRVEIGKRRMEIIPPSTLRIPQSLRKEEQLKP